MTDMRPNFLVFITDRQRYDHLSCAGNGVLRTLNIGTSVRVSFASDDGARRPESISDGTHVVSVTPEMNNGAWKKLREWLAPAP